MKNKRIEIIGGIATGKTTLTKILEKNNLNCVIEDFTLNPFWKSFYLNPGKFIFETEVTFLLQHYHAIKKSLGKGKDFVCDFSLLGDLAYAKIGLKSNKLYIFESVYSEIISEIYKPNLLIYLECEPKIQLERIKNRNREEEKLISVEFLSTLNEAIKNEVVNKENVLKINSSKVDFVKDNNSISKTLDHIKSALK